MGRIDDLRRFYKILDRHQAAIGGARLLADEEARLGLPPRGVYFFFEPGELRSNSGSGPRVVRVGTHAVSRGAKSTLWSRLAQHRGTLKTGGGNHRGSVFRYWIGKALIRKNPRFKTDFPDWDFGSSAPSEISLNEQPMEKNVSRHIRQMPFLWLSVDDAPGPKSRRKLLEKNCIALLSNYTADRFLDQPSPGWLGLFCPEERISKSGLWNSRHVDEDYAPEFLTILEALVKQGASGPPGSGKRR